MALATKTGGPREVRLAKDAQSELKIAAQKYERVQQVYDGLAWRIARDPNCGQALPPDFYENGEAGWSLQIVRSGNLPAGLPCVNLTYRFNDDVVEILHLRAFAPGRDPTF